VAIDNRGGAGGNVGTDAVLRARPDGYTLLAANSSSMAINPHTFPRMTSDPLQLVSIGLILKSALILCVHPSVPARDVPEFAAWVRAQRQGVNYGTPASGSMSHCAMELFRNRVGLPAMEHVPLPRQRPGHAGLHRRPVQRDVRRRLGGRALRQGQPGARHPRHGRAPHPGLPRHPDFGRGRAAGLHLTAWIGMFAPPGTPPEIVARLNQARHTAVQDQSARERITRQGDEPGGGTPEQLAEATRRDHARWGEVVRAANIMAE
jgi:tripartite-type tricarboxylate transporter receptor subunit TctC